MPRIKASLSGFLLAGAFLLLATLAFLQHLHSVKTNPADSGESAVLFFLFTLPWGLLTPLFLDAIGYNPYNPGLIKWNYVTAWGEVVLNALLLYCAAGGIRLKNPNKTE